MFSYKQWQLRDSKQCCSTFSSLPWKVLISHLKTLFVRIANAAQCRSLSVKKLFSLETMIRYTKLVFIPSSIPLKSLSLVKTRDDKISSRCAGNED